MDQDIVYSSFSSYRGPTSINPRQSSDEQNVHSVVVQHQQQQSQQEPIFEQLLLEVTNMAHDLDQKIKDLENKSIFSQELQDQVQSAELELNMWKVTSESKSNESKEKALKKQKQLEKLRKKLEDHEAANRPKKPKRARPAAPDLSPGNYLNLISDDSVDEICFVENRGSIRRTPCRKRNLNSDITLSGRKTKLERTQDIDLSPISPIRKSRAKTKLAKY